MNHPDPAFADWLNAIANTPDEVSPPTNAILLLTALYMVDTHDHSQREKFLDAVSTADLDWILEYGGFGAIYLAHVMWSARNKVQPMLLTKAAAILQPTSDPK